MQFDELRRREFITLLGGRVALRISRTVFSALSGTRLLACLIVAPQRATRSQQSSLTQSAHSVRQVLTAYTQSGFEGGGRAKRARWGLICWSGGGAVGSPRY